MSSCLSPSLLHLSPNGPLAKIYFAAFWNLPWRLYAPPSQLGSEPPSALQRDPELSQLSGSFQFMAGMGLLSVQLQPAVHSVTGHLLAALCNVAILNQNPAAFMTSYEVVCPARAWSYQVSKDFLSAGDGTVIMMAALPACSGQALC